MIKKLSLAFFFSACSLAAQNECDWGQNTICEVIPTCVDGHRNGSAWHILNNCTYPVELDDAHWDIKQVGSIYIDLNSSQNVILPLGRIDILKDMPIDPNHKFSLLQAHQAKTKK